MPLGHSHSGCDFAAIHARSQKLQHPFLAIFTSGIVEILPLFICHSKLTGSGLRNSDSFVVNHWRNVVDESSLLIRPCLPSAAGGGRRQ